MSSKFKQKGFTLIELIVTITVIGLLVTIAIPMYQNALKSGRDAKRQADLKGIQSALEQFHSDHIYYPSNGGTCGNGVFKIGCSLTSNDGTSKTYLTKVPTDPLTTNLDYCYLPSSCDSSSPPKCTGTYKLYANLERITGNSYTCNSQTYNLEVAAP